MKTLITGTLTKYPPSMNILVQVLNLTTNHYDAPKHLKPMKLDDLGENHIVAFGEDRRVVGVISYTKITSNLIRTYREVVDKYERRKGIGQKLNETLEAVCKEKGISKITCNIYTDNIANISLKLKRDYIIEGLLRNHNGIGIHEYIVSKELKK